MKKLISILGITTIASSIMPGVVGNSPYQTNNITQYQVLKMKNFVSDNTATVNLNDVLWMKRGKTDTFVQFANGSKPITYSNTLMWNKTIDQIKDNAQYFRNESTILNINDIIRANNNNEFISNNGISTTLGANAYNEFIKHINYKILNILTMGTFFMLLIIIVKHHSSSISNYHNNNSI